MEQRLSDFLLEQVELFDRNGVNPPSKGDRIARGFLENIAERIIDARESFTGDDFDILGFQVSNAMLQKAIRADPESIECDIDRVLSQRVLEKIPAMTKRLIQLSSLEGVRIPSKQTAVYIQEAARTYLFGFMQASAAMSRAALEQAIKEVLGRQGDGNHIEFKDLINEAEKWNILDGTTGPAVRDYAKKANGVLHEVPTDEAGAFDILISIRGLIVQIYSSKGGF